MSEECKNTVVAMVRKDGTPVEKPCGIWFAGEKLLCETCFKQALEDYPQGWRGYPGDICRHGTYVGGCGVDYTCPRCEYEDTSPSPSPEEMDEMYREYLEEDAKDIEVELKKGRRAG